MKSFDIVVVSSSPSMILEALYLESKGFNVAIFDQRSRIGGAWYVKNLFGYENVEVGCHFIYNNNSVYSFLDTLGLNNLEIMRPQPSVLFSSLKRKNTFSRLSNFTFIIKNIFFKDSFISCRNMQIISGIRDFLQQKNIILFIKGLINFISYKPYKYFINGCGELMHNLDLLLLNSSIKLFLNVSVNNIKISPNLGGEFMINDEKIMFKKILISKHVKFKNLFIEKLKISYPREPWRKKHYVLKIRGSFKRKISYVDVVNDSVLMRVSNVGQYCNNIEPNIILVCCDTINKINDSNSQQNIKNLIFKRLIYLNLISDNSILDDYFVEEFISDYTPNEKLVDLNKKSKGVIINIDTSDLGKSINIYKDKWIKIFKK